MNEQEVQDLLKRLRAVREELNQRLSSDDLDAPLQGLGPISRTPITIMLTEREPVLFKFVED